MHTFSALFDITVPFFVFAPPPNEITFRRPCVGIKVPDRQRCWSSIIPRGSLPLEAVPHPCEKKKVCFSGVGTECEYRKHRRTRRGLGGCSPQWRRNALRRQCFGGSHCLWWMACPPQKKALFAQSVLAAPPPPPAFFKLPFSGKKHVIFGQNHLIFGQAMEKIFGQLTSAPLNETGPVRLWSRKWCQNIGDKKDI